MKKHHLQQHGRPPCPVASSALDSALRILARRDHTCKELAGKLRQKGFERAAIDGALKRSRELGYLDDARTAMAIAGHLAERGYGPLRIRYTLGQKGVDGAIVEKAMSRCGDEAAQVHRARQLLEKKAASFGREADPWVRRQKAGRFLAGRGFSSAVINRAIGDP